MSKKFEDLEVWKSAKTLAVLVYSKTDGYPKNEQFALTNQTNRAAVSIPANIAEGTSRQSIKDFIHFLDIAIGSAFELETLLVIAFERRYINELKNLRNELDRVIKLLYGLRRSLYEKQ